MEPCCGVVVLVRRWHRQVRLFRNAIRLRAPLCCQFAFAVQQPPQPLQCQQASSQTPDTNNHSPHSFPLTAPLIPSPGHRLHAQHHRHLRLLDPFRFRFRLVRREHAPHRTAPCPRIERQQPLPPSQQRLFWLLRCTMTRCVVPATTEIGERLTPIPRARARRLCYTTSASFCAPLAQTGWLWRGCARPMLHFWVGCRLSSAAHAKASSRR